MLLRLRDYETNIIKIKTQHNGNHIGTINTEKGVKIKLLPQPVPRGVVLEFPSPRPSILVAWTSLERPRGDWEGAWGKSRGRGVKS